MVHMCTLAQWSISLDLQDWICSAKPAGQLLPSLAKVIKSVWHASQKSRWSSLKNSLLVNVSNLWKQRSRRSGGGLVWHCSCSCCWAGDTVKRHEKIAVRAMAFIFTWYFMVRINLGWIPSVQQWHVQPAVRGGRQYWAENYYIKWYIALSSFCRICCRWKCVYSYTVLWMQRVHFHFTCAGCSLQLANFLDTNPHETQVGRCRHHP